MIAQDIINGVKALNFPQGAYIVFGSCPMTLAGIREAGDIDMLVSEELFKKLEDKGWKEVDKGKNDKPLTYKDFEAHKSWNFSAYKPTLAHLLSSATIVEDIPFASLEEVRKWKTASGRPKDLVDVKLINEYLDVQ